MGKLSFVIVSSLAAAVAAFPSPASAGPCADATGAVRKETRRVGTFDAIELDGAVDLRLTQGAKPSVVVEAPDSAVSLIQTTASSGRLRVAMTECVRTSGAVMRVHVTVPTLRAIEVRGAGEVEGVGTLRGDELALTVHGAGELTLALQVDALAIAVYGAGELTLTGRAATQRVDIHGAGEIEGFGLTSARAIVRVYGAGEVEVHATDELDAEIGGAGEITYRGKPKKLRKAIHGVGEIRAD